MSEFSQLMMNYMNKNQGQTVFANKKGGLKFDEAQTVFFYIYKEQKLRSEY